ncbi:uncharacterized protein K452DRAFT_279756 [Aplosporella prunicola CBS 121167]|uniref:Magnesium transporter n=1 Tax=Aplosporella prunicola CBS 121167 TaxID=1176127 RepID=A0A6A6AZW4_9PEZI|nr:uncharacterized protein K452DRAFT_279756 [Aplosporella prunicola CBS 121167]KAF2136554.1 hypothetical protein K452DRAFT_279756 [Aplosporella prunicola CBS 121167]
MRPIPLRHGAAPSPALLRFLRAQTESHLCSPAGSAFPQYCAKARASFPTTTALVGDSSLRSPFASPARYQSSWAARSSSRLSPLPASRLAAAPELPGPHHAHTPLRRLSSKSLASFWDRWLGRRKPASKLHADDLPPRNTYTQDEGGIRRPRPINELRLRCTEFDENGNVTLVSGEFRKSELIAKYSLLPRDLRKIDSSMLPHILIRPSAILINLLHLRVLIKHNRVLVFDAYGTTNTHAQSAFMYDLEGRLNQKDLRQNGSLPYEFRALEAVLISVTTGLESEFEGVREPVAHVLKELEEDIDRDKLRYLLVYSKRLGRFEQQARLVRDALDELLEADDDLADMYLTEKAEGKDRGEHDHSEVELLLESYHKVADEIVQAAEEQLSSIRNTEEIVKAILDANRNSLMLLELKYAVWTLGLTAGTFVAALYGMNLQNFIEETDWGFWGVSACCAIITVVATSAGLGKLRRVQRVKMWGEHGRYSSMKGSWRDTGEAGLMAPSSRVPPVGGAAAAVGPASLNTTDAVARKEKLKKLPDFQTARKVLDHSKSTEKVVKEAEDHSKSMEKVVKKAEDHAERGH